MKCGCGRVLMTDVGNATQPRLEGLPEYHHATPAPTYSKRNACIMGDAAHAMTPWQGSGVGQAIEDAMILETVQRGVTDRSQILPALKAYDQIHRPRSQRVVASSHGTGMILCGRGPESGGDIERVREVLPKRWDFIYGHDQKVHKQEALEVMRTLQLG